MIRFRVMIVEDEPPAARYIRTLVEETGGFVVSAIYESGEDALEELGHVSPDVLISDIRMGGMTGLELIRRAREQNPQIISIVISGYKMFEYAQEAIKLDIADYLLKPIDREEMEKSLTRIRSRLLQEYREKRRKGLEFLFQNGVEEDAVSEISQYFPYPYLQILLLYSNGKQDALLQTVSQLVRHLDSGSLCTAPYRNGVLVLEGLEACSKQPERLKRLEIMFKAGNAARLPVFWLWGKEPCRTEEILGTIKGMYRFIKRRVSFGEEACMVYPEAADAEKTGLPVLARDTEELLKGILSGSQQQAETAFVRLFSGWEKNEAGIYGMKAAICEMLSSLHQSGRFQLHLAAANEQLEECVRLAGSFSEFQMGVWELISEILQAEKGDEKAQKAENIYQRITALLHHDIAENYTLQDISRMFDISQPYVSRLFRTYFGGSYKEYVLKLKIDRAIELMEQDPSCFMKEIAEQVGFDSLYFSTVFRRMTGVYPSQYREQLGKSGKSGL